MSSSAALRRALADHLVDSGMLRSSAVRQAFLRVPREAFVPEFSLPQVYADEALVVSMRGGTPTSSSSQPSIMALMLDALDVHKGHNVLEVGLGPGYNAALLSRLVGPSGRVTAVDIDPEMVGRASAALAATGHPVETAIGDGRAGWPSSAPYDRIIVTASGTSIPHAWWSQLAPDGLLVAPLRLDALQLVAVFARTSDGLRTVRLIPGGFMALRDSAEAAADAGASIILRFHQPRHGATMITATGPGLAGLSTYRQQSIVEHLVSRPRRSRIAHDPAVPVIWHTALTSEPRRHLTIYKGQPGIRFGLVDRATGGFSMLVGTRTGTKVGLTGIESYGPDPRGAAELREHWARWRAAGSPALEQLSIEVSYGGGPTRSALRTVRHDDQVIRFSWDG